MVYDVLPSSANNGSDSIQVIATIPRNQDAAYSNDEYQQTAQR